MKGKQRPLGFIVVLALGLALVLGGGFTRPAMASSEDVAMFYDDLGQYGQWVDYENYGPVWSPSNVNEDWRPYTDGRWVPTNDGYVFESQEPWGWATYHYGNWMPTPNYGWVWAPGRTWYPSTVEWRTSPETEAVDTSYVGWAPIPPPDYVPTQSYAPPGYYPGAPAGDALTSPLWVFARAASFLLGFGQPYTPAYSYGGCGCLAPPSYVPVFFNQTMFVPNYYTPSYYPQSYFGGGFGGAYSYGPPVNYISRVTNINQTVINNTIINNSTNIHRIHNVMPPQAVLTRNAGLRQITPPALVQGQRLPPAQRLTNVNAARANLGKPNIIHAPKNVPPLTAQIPKAQPLAAQPPKGVVPGATLPAKSTMQLTPNQQQQVQKLPPNKQITPVRPGLTGQPAATPGAKPPVQPGVQPGAKPGMVQPGVKPGQVQPGGPPHPGAVQPGAPGKPGQVQPGVAPHPGATPAVPPAGPKPGQVPPGVKPGATPAVPPSGLKPGQAPPGVKPGATPAVPGAHGPATPAVPPAGPRPGQTPPGVKPGATPAVPGAHGPATPAIPPSGLKPATPGQPQPQVQPQRPQPQVQPQRPQPQVQPQRPQPQPQHVTPPPARPQPQVQPRPAPQPQPQRVAPPPQPRPQPQVQQPRPQPQPQPQRVAPAPAARPQPAPAPAPKPQPAPQKQQPKKPGEQPQ